MKDHNTLMEEAWAASAAARVALWRARVTAAAIEREFDRPILCIALGLGDSVEWWWSNDRSSKQQ